MLNAHSRSSIYASRLFARRKLDLRARLVAVRTSGERLIIHGRTRDLSHTGAGLTITHELPTGVEVMLCLPIPGHSTPLCLHAVVIRRTGFRVGLQFVRPTPEQRLLLHELCRH